MFESDSYCFSPFLKRTPPSHHKLKRREVEQRHLRSSQKQRLVHRTIHRKFTTPALAPAPAHNPRVQLIGDHR